MDSEDKYVLKQYFVTKGSYLQHNYLGPGYGDPEYCKDISKQLFFKKNM